MLGCNKYNCERSANGVECSPLIASRLSDQGKLWLIAMNNIVYFTYHSDYLSITWCSSRFTIDMTFLLGKDHPTFEPLRQSHCERRSVRENGSLTLAASEPYILTLLEEQG